MCGRSMIGKSQKRPCQVIPIVLSCIWAQHQHTLLGEYRNMACAVQCRDCLKEGLGKFHILGMKEAFPFSYIIEMWFFSGVKCEDCGSYNTTRVKGPLLRRGRGRGPLIPPNLVVDSSEEDDENEMPPARPSVRYGHLGVRPYRQGRRCNRVPPHLRRRLITRRDPEVPGPGNSEGPLSEAAWNDPMAIDLWRNVQIDPSEIDLYKKSTKRSHGNSS